MSIFDLEENTGAQAPSEVSFADTRAAYLAALEKRALELAEDNNLDLSEADTRFSTALSLRSVRNALVAIVGAGGLGNWQWRILASMGFKRIAIYDNDSVGIENIGPQAHSIFDLGIPKVEAVANAAMIYRGMRIIARNKRVSTFEEIREDLGETPDIVIGCTDSAEFRNAFGRNLRDIIYTYAWHSMSSKQIAEVVPELYIDYRMSLGDWVAYILPLRAMAENLGSPDGAHASIQGMFSWYNKVALFPPEQALHEPCTERAIAYTGASVASYTGALLHWLFSGGQAKLRDFGFFHEFTNGRSQSPGRTLSFSSRDFEFISSTARENALLRKIDKLKEAMATRDAEIAESLGLPEDCTLLEMAWGLDASERPDYAGTLVYDPRGHRTCVVGHGGLFVLGALYGDIANTNAVAEYIPSGELPDGPYMVFERGSEYRHRGVCGVAAKPLGTLFYDRGVYYKSSAEGMYWVTENGCTSDQVSLIAWDKLTIINNLVEASDIPDNVAAAFSGAVSKHTDAEVQALSLETIRPGMSVRFIDDDSGAIFRVLTVDSRIVLEDNDIGAETFLSLRYVGKLTEAA